MARKVVHVAGRPKGVEDNVIEPRSVGSGGGYTWRSLSEQWEIVARSPVEYVSPTPL